MQTTRVLFDSPSTEKAHLVSISNKNEIIEMGDFLTIGRASHNTLIIDDAFVSQRHARIEKRGNDYIIKDLRSTNGTLVNETPVLEAKLTQNDRIRFGETVYVFTTRSAARPQELSSKNQEWQKQLDRLPVFASTNYTVLINGPSGSGKELLAHYVHNLSSRKHAPFVAINCSALSEQLIESELFGHVKGAFTGADQDRRGAFETARGGTLFLDEIGDLPMNLQPKLLRALENQEIRPVGSDRTIKTDVRIVAATHKNLYEKVIKKEFREDLFHRLNVCRISPPSLIDRIEDFDTIFYNIAREMRVRFSFAAIEKMKDHTWPGNIRELKNVIARASAYYPSQSIEEGALADLIDKPMNTDTLPLDNLPPLKELERDLIVKQLERHFGNQRKAAEDLKMPKSTLNDKLRYYNIDPQEYKKRSRV
ncbi:MAG: sigma 54-interacting transcriptional regulator [Bdellovibrionaceae bacterium]|nr:sigma 54-interacting transcriptional regulator [Pseudobdellovibrionaceae bacterium]